MQRRDFQAERKAGFSDRLKPCVDELVADFLVLCPERHQSPSASLYKCARVSAVITPTSCCAIFHEARKFGIAVFGRL